MNNTSISDALDRVISGILASKSGAESSVGETSSVADMVPIVRELQCLPRPQFKSQLKVELEWEVAGRSMTQARPCAAHSSSQEILPTFNRLPALYPLRGRNVMASVAMHAGLLILLALVVLSAHRAPQILGRTDYTRAVNLSAYSPAKGTGSGSTGGGGAHDRVNASKGVLPPPSAIQISTPIVELQNQHPMLAVRASIIAPPDLNLPSNGPLGDPLSPLLTPSGGPGVRSGIGAGEEGGIGAKSGPGNGTGAFGPGNGISWPRAIYHPEPEFSDEARREHYQGVVSLLIVVGPDGRAHNMRILRALGMGLDEKAMEAVRTWRFEPGTKDGRAVPVLMEVDVDFRIH